MGKIGRNAPCPCGSGKKYKKCCLSSQKGNKNPATQEMRYVPVFTRLDRLSNSVWELIEKNKLDEAEAVCRRLSKEYPDQIDGIHRLAQVYEARGERAKAAEYYRKAAEFARTECGFDQESIDDFLSDARRMES